MSDDSEVETIRLFRHIRAQDVAENGALTMVERAIAWNRQGMIEAGAFPYSIEHGLRTVPNFHDDYSDEERAACQPGDMVVRTIARRAKKEPEES